jgi:protein PhnA
MSIQKELEGRSGTQCELCTSTNQLSVYHLPPNSMESVDESILVCDTCKSQIEDASLMDSNHWRCLNDSMWSAVPAVQVMAWRLLNRIKDQGWPQDLLDMLYLDEETLAWAAATGEGESDDEKLKYVDCNGVELHAGDTVVLTKDLNVKGTSFVAKRGTAVRNIALAYEDPTHIEGKVNGQTIYIVTKFVKKS